MTAIAEAASRPAADRSRTAGETARKRYLVAALCVVVVFIMLAPIALSIFASIKLPQEASAVPPDYLPHSLSFDNYLKVFDFQAGLPTYLMNSLVIAFLTIVFCLVLAVPAGYGLGRFNVPFKEPIFILLLAGMMIPYQSLLTPLYMMFSKVGLANTYVGLAMVHTILQLPFSIYLMRNSFEGIPKEIEEAAVSDGCTSFQALRRVFLPLVMPGMVTVALFAFITSWNEFIAALIFMNKESSFTVPIMLVAVRSGHYGAIDWGALEASVIISIIPCVLIYLLLQKYYVSGFLSGAVK